MEAQALGHIPTEITKAPNFIKLTVQTIIQSSQIVIMRYLNYNLGSIGWFLTKLKFILLDIYKPIHNSLIHN